MNDKLVAYLKAARELLSRTYVKFWSTHPDGVRHCAMGALQHTQRGYPDGYYLRERAQVLLGGAARRQHPEMEGARSERKENGGGFDRFNDNPIVYINNHTDRETTLAVFDEAIASLEGVPVPAEMVKAKEVVHA